MSLANDLTRQLRSGEALERFEIQKRNDLRLSKLPTNSTRRLAGAWPQSPQMIGLSWPSAASSRSTIMSGAKKAWGILLRVATRRLPPPLVSSWMVRQLPMASWQSAMHGGTCAEG